MQAGPCRLKTMNMKTKNGKLVTDEALTQAPDAVETVKSEENQGLCLETTREKIGARSVEVADLLFQQSLRLQSDPVPTNQTALRALRMPEEMSPGNAIEGMLAVQMIGVHNAAVEFIKHSQLPGQTVEGVDSNVARAYRLMRLFTEQLDAMAKLKGTAGNRR